MKRKISNLEEYYNEINDKLFTMKFFCELTNEELNSLETSEGFRKFLIRGAWTKGFTILICFVLLPISIILAIYLKHIA